MKLYYTLPEVAREARCSETTVKTLIAKYGINPHRSPTLRMRFTADQKDSIVRLRWLTKDWRKCVEYCWKNNVKVNI